MIDALAADRARFADLEVQILLLQRPLSELQSEKELVLECLNSYKYPVLTLPNEIIAEAFVHFLPVYPLCPPLTEIALATPKLWRAISLEAGDIPLAQQLNICRTWMTRSCSCPLSIRGLEASQFLDTVTPHRARWEYFGLTIAGYPSPISPLEGPIPVLRHLSLTLESPDELGPDDVVTFPEAPSLRSLTISYSTLSTPTVILPFAQLTSLALHRAFRHEYVEILPQTPKLVHCELVIEFDSTTDPPPAGVELPRLEVLVLSVFKTLGSRPLPTKCLDDFIVPALRHLRIPESLLQPSPVVDTLSSFVSKSNCRLRELCIEGRTSESEDSYRNAFRSTHVSFEE
ncbi:hypothetical protein B0H14DRAFT_2770440 [Mycena olivaceomarginata]|nr:hypothetical protein B0H14DRAFT_2770440 [Mycena olivaceomarginata]